MSKLINTKNPHFKLRFAEEKDAGLILSFIKELAIYENLLSEVKATEAILLDSIFKRKVVEVVIGEYEGLPVGFALFFYNFSTFLGKPGIYLEDLYIRQEAREKGLGKILLSFIAFLAVERDCGRFEWACLDWNEPSINFYKKMGAVAMDQWTVYRLQDSTLTDLANEF